MYQPLYHDTKGRPSCGTLCAYGQLLYFRIVVLCGKLYNVSNLLRFITNCLPLKWLCLMNENSAQSFLQASIELFGGLYHPMPLKSLDSACVVHSKATWSSNRILLRTSYYLHRLLPFPIFSMVVCPIQLRAMLATYSPVSD